jgi:hypothetical protein
LTETAPEVCFFTILHRGIVLIVALGKVAGVPADMDADMDVWWCDYCTAPDAVSLGSPLVLTPPAT